MDVFITVIGVLVVLFIFGSAFFLYYALKKALRANEELTVALNTVEEFCVVWFKANRDKF